MSETSPGSLLIADDEPLARRTIREYLTASGWIGEIHEAGDGHAAVRLANQMRPSLIFLDIVMPGLSGLEVLERLAYQPRIIFTTAHDRYAILAFELGALDYLLKPFGRERFQRTLTRTRAVNHEVSVLARASQTLQSAEPLSRIFVRDGSRILPIALAELERVQGAGDYVTLFAGKKEFLVDVRMTELEARLCSANFLRIHRSHLVNLDFVTAIEPYDGARSQVLMRSGIRIVASRPGSRRLRDLAV